MTISATDIKLRTPERLTDNADGGGRQTSGTIVDGELNNLSALEQIYWRRRPTMRRDSTLIEAGRVALKLTAAQVDALFAAAASVQT